MHWQTHSAYSLRTSALAVLVTLVATAMGHSTEVVFNGLDYFSEGGQWFVAYGGDTFRVAPDAIDVRFRDGVSAAAIDSVLAVAGVTRMRTDRRGFHYLRLPERADVLQTAMGLSELPEVELAETGFEIKLLSNPNDQYFDYQWYLHNTGTVRGDTTATEDADVDAPEAWEIETGDTTAIIAIIDQGIDRSHTDLSRSVWRNWDDPLNSADDDSNGYVDDYWGWNFSEGNNNTLPDEGDGHGTTVAGVAGATSNNSRGIAGLAGGEGSTPRRSCLLMAIRCDLENSMHMASAIDYADSNGARVVNMSWGTAPSQCVSEAISDAFSHGVLLVAATAYTSGESSWPATHQDVMGVGCTNWNDGYGVYRKGTEIWAPGLQVPGHSYSLIYTTDYSGGPPDEYCYQQGSSLATPQVAAIGALLFSRDPELTAEECRQLIIAGADSLGTSGIHTVRRANARGALDALCDASRIDPHLSSVTLSDSSCVVLCPASDLDTLVVQITLRTSCGEPIANVPANSITVTLLENVLYNFQLCCGSSFQLNADAPTDTNGMTTATITAGAGVDPAVAVRVTAAGVALDDGPVVDLRSVAYDGECVVPESGEDVLPDLDCDGIPDGVGDHALVEAHYGHQCPSRGRAERAVEPETVARRLSASHAFPNPLSSTGSVSYELPCDTYVEVCVYAMTGRRVRVLERGHQTAGSHSATWDGLDEHGRPAASGVYFIRISTPEEDVLRTGVIVR